MSRVRAWVGPRPAGEWTVVASAKRALRGQYVICGLDSFESTLELLEEPETEVLEILGIFFFVKGAIFRE